MASERVETGPGRWRFFTTGECIAENCGCAEMHRIYCDAAGKYHKRGTYTTVVCAVCGTRQEEIKRRGS